MTATLGKEGSSRQEEKEEDFHEFRWLEGHAADGKGNLCPVGDFTVYQHGTQHHDAQDAVGPRQLLQEAYPGQRPGDEQGHRQGQQHDDILPDRPAEGQPGYDAQPDPRQHAHIVQQQAVGLVIYGGHHDSHGQQEHLYERVEEHIFQVPVHERQVREQEQLDHEQEDGLEGVDGDLLPPFVEQAGEAAQGIDCHERRYDEF